MKILLVLLMFAPVFTILTYIFIRKKTGTKYFLEFYLGVALSIFMSFIFYSFYRIYYTEISPAEYSIIMKNIEKGGLNKELVKEALADGFISPVEKGYLEGEINSEKEQDIKRRIVNDL